MRRLVHQFSLPTSVADERVFETVVTTHGRAAASSLLHEHGDQIASTSDGLIDFVSGWTQSDATWETVWDLAFGRAYLALKSGRLNPSEVAACLALRLTDSGYQGSWRATIPPTTIRLGHSLLSSIEEIKVDGSGATSRIIVRGASGTKTEGTRDAKSGAWHINGADNLLSFGINRPIHLLPGHALPSDDDDDGPTFDGTNVIATPDATMVRAFGAGLAAIAEHAPEYLPWIERVLRSIVVSVPEETYRLESGSGEDIPGVIHASQGLTAMDIAEILVHECAHQYFYMLEKVGPVDDGTDRKLYWSPPIRADRPLSRILMAYQALANVRIFYESVRSSAGGDVAYVETNEKEMDEAVASLDVPLRGNHALTDLGRGLYEPLAERIAALSN